MTLPHYPPCSHQLDELLKIMKNTEERIKEILQEMVNFKYNELNMVILKLELESLVTQAQIEQLKMDK